VLNPGLSSPVPFGPSRRRKGDRMPIITHKLEHPDGTPLDRPRPAVARSAEEAWRGQASSACALSGEPPA
jgi:hypothetical protein